MSHEPFDGRQNAITLNHDIASYSQVFETMEKQVVVAETDNGRLLQEQMDDLKMLLDAYRAGVIKEDHK